MTTSGATPSRTARGLTMLRGEARARRRGGRPERPRSGRTATLWVRPAAFAAARRLPLSGSRPARRSSSRSRRIRSLSARQQLLRLQVRVAGVRRGEVGVLEQAAGRRQARLPAGLASALDQDRVHARPGEHAERVQVIRRRITRRGPRRAAIDRGSCRASPGQHRQRVERRVLIRQDERRRARRPDHSIIMLTRRWSRSISSAARPLLWRAGCVRLQKRRSLRSSWPTPGSERALDDSCSVSLERAREEGITRSVAPVLAETSAASRCSRTSAARRPEHLRSGAGAGHRAPGRAAAGEAAASRGRRHGGSRVAPMGPGRRRSGAPARRRAPPRLRSTSRRRRRNRWMGGRPRHHASRGRDRSGVLEWRPRRRARPAARIAVNALTAVVAMPRTRDRIRTTAQRSDP